MNILVTNWDKVEDDDFYLTDKWFRIQGTDKDTREEIRRLQKIGKLYIAYIVPAERFVLDYQMEAFQVFIDEDFNVVLECEGAIIESWSDDTNFENKRVFREP